MVFLVFFRSWGRYRNVLVETSLKDCYLCVFRCLRCSFCPNSRNELFLAWPHPRDAHLAFVMTAQPTQQFWPAHIYRGVCVVTWGVVFLILQSVALNIGLKLLAGRCGATAQKVLVWSNASDWSNASKFPPHFNSGLGSGRYEPVVPDVSGHVANVLPDVAQQVLALERQGLGRKIIAMSLFGNDPRYVQGALMNALLAQREWSGWTLRIYYGEGVPESVIAKLHAFDVELVRMHQLQSPRLCMYWRFYALEDRTATRIIVRDADAVLSSRDRAAVKEWEESQWPFHTMHDHLRHELPIMGGMWGAVNGLLHPRIIEEWRQSGDQSTHTQKWHNDQTWLEDVVWPLVKNYTLDHASYSCGKRQSAEWRGFPTQRLHKYDFVGNVYSPLNNFVGRAVKTECPAACRRHPDWKSC